jgi:K+-sensing histidine kinase KdpD
MPAAAPALASGPAQWPLPVRIIAALLGVVAALVLTRWIGSWIEHTRLAFFYAAVAAAAALGGLALAGVAAIAAILAAELFVFSPYGTLTLTTQSITRDAAFFVAAMVIAVLVDRLQRASRHAQVRQREAEHLAEALREQAGELELQVTDAEALANEMEDINLQLTEQTDVSSRAAVRAERLHQFTALLLEQVGEAAVSAAIVEDGRRALLPATG